MHVAERPATREQLAEALGAAGDAGRAVRIAGAGTKAGWGGRSGAEALELSTLGLDRIVEHNAGDLTAILEAGVPLARAQETFASEGQMLALDPPCADATIGGIVATGDTGPLRARYGGPRDLVVGMRVALSDGSIAKSGGKVIKNVAGYDLAKLFTGAFGTLGAILEVAVRLHPRPPRTATAMGSSSDPDELARAAIALARSPLEQHGLDVRWAAGGGTVLARFAGVEPCPQAEAAKRLLRDQGVPTEILDEDEPVWEEQRQAQRGPLVLKVSGRPGRLAEILRGADAVGGRVVGRAALGLCWIRVEEPEAGVVERLRGELAPSPCVVLDRPPALELDPWGPVDPAALALMRRVKVAFDPAGVCNPGAYVGGL
jgi:glycolate oxidase FAD binding subunit